MTTPFDDLTPPPTRKPGIFARLRSSFLTGIVVIAPVGLTIWLIWSVIGWVDSVVLPFIPASFYPDNLLRDLIGDQNYAKWLGENTTINIRGVGLVIFLIFTVIVGWLAKGIMGRSIIRRAETLVARMPIVRSIYGGVKQIAEAMLAQSGNNFEKACLVEYPRKGAWAIGFISTSAKGEIVKRVNAADGGRPVLSVFVPTTPNPTSGFLLFFPAEEVIELDMTIEDAAKLVISAGLVYPDEIAQKADGARIGHIDSQ